MSLDAQRFSFWVMDHESVLKKERPIEKTDENREDNRTMAQFLNDRDRGKVRCVVRIACYQLGKSLHVWQRDDIKYTRTIS